MRSARPHADLDESSGQDSFLDIVANIVGILILLVMVVGVRAARRPVDQPEVGATTQDEAIAEAATEPEAPDTSADDTLAADTRVAERRAAALQKETLELAARSVDAREEVELQDGVRVQLAAYVAQTEEALASKRQELADEQRVDYDNRVAIAEAQQRLEELTRQQAAQLAEAVEVETIENLPTPLAKTVDGNELYLMLTEGGVAVIPLDALRDQLQRRLDSRIQQLRGRDEISFMVGPVGGFRMRFLVQKAIVSGPTGRRVALRPLWELVPSDDLITEPVDQAVQEGSALQTALALHPPHDTTISVITYADSFNEFRVLKKALYERGYAVAGRPLEVGKPVIGSPQGRRSAAQ